MPAAILASVLAVAGATTMTLAGPGRLDVLEPAAARLPGALVVEHRRLRDGGERERHHEALRRLGGDDQRLEAVLDEAAHQLDGLVDGDAARDTDEHGAGGMHGGSLAHGVQTGHSGFSWSILLSTISSKAIVSRLVLRVVMSGGVSSSSPSVFSPRLW